MTTVIVAVAALVAAAVMTVAYTSLVRSLVRSHARERDLLTNQLLNLAGKPWQPAPAEPARREPPAAREYRPDPAQLPDDWTPVVIEGGEG